MSKKRGLGKGLNALLGGTESLQQINQMSAKPVTETTVEMGSGSVEAAPGEVVKAVEQSSKEFKSLAIEKIQRGKYQPRRQFDQQALNELADSIKSHGLVQPILVRERADGQYELVAGERRWRAAQLAGLDKIPAVIKDLVDDEAAAIALIENIQREDLNPLEEAMALEGLQKEFSLTHQQIADAVGRSRASVSNLLRLLDLHEEVKKLLLENHIEMGHARALLALPMEQQLQLARVVDKQALSVRATEALVRKAQEEKVEKIAKVQAIDPNIASLQEQLSDNLGAKVLIKHKKGGKGKIEINYNSLDELDGVLANMKQAREMI